MSTKPGITGMWQVSGRSDITDFEKVVRLDNQFSRRYIFIIIIFTFNLSEKYLSCKLFLLHHQDTLQDVLWKEMTDEQKVVKFSMYFEKISSEDKELIIIDPYFFKDDSDEYHNVWQTMCLGEVRHLYMVEICERMVIQNNYSR